ncbi:MAG: hypothetical protein AB6733_23285 [Clostridiaceae bacterium]
MNKYNKVYFRISIVLVVLGTIVIPASLIDDGIVKLGYGFPFNFMTIYQIETRSIWFLDNFFNGNSGLSIDILKFIFNIFVVYNIIVLVMKYVINRKRFIQ